MNSLGIRMKGYEFISRLFLMKRNPVIIRVDGKAFHTFTKGMNKPFDQPLIETMQETALELCKNIQGVKLAYTQSDEISLVLTDYDKIDTQGWFNYNLQKMCSISASMTTLYFNNIFNNKFYDIHVETNKRFLDGEITVEELEDAIRIYGSKRYKALFDSRAFSIPKDEVCNYFIWRQQDATRNSIQMVGQANFSHKELQGKNCNQIQDMLLTQKDINWNNLATPLKRGSCVIKDDNGKWYIDNNIPIFTEDRDYVQKLI